MNVVCCWSIGDKSGMWPACPAGEDKLPSLMRRRLSPLGRKGLETIYQGLNQIQGRAIPWVVACRHGDISRRHELLTALKNGEALSPTHFSMSVHNANIGLFSIATGNKETNTALAGGEKTFESGLIEVLALQKQKGGLVGLLYYDYMNGVGLSRDVDLDDRICSVAMVIGDIESGMSLTHQGLSRTMSVDKFDIVDLLSFLENDEPRFRIPVAGGEILLQRDN